MQLQNRTESEAQKSRCALSFVVQMSTCVARSSGIYDTVKKKKNLCLNCNNSMRLTQKSNFWIVSRLVKISWQLFQRGSRGISALTCWCFLRQCNHFGCKMSLDVLFTERHNYLLAHQTRLPESARTETRRRPKISKTLVTLCSREHS